MRDQSLLWSDFGRFVPAFSLEHKGKKCWRAITENKGAIWKARECPYMGLSSKPFCPFQSRDRSLHC